MIIFILYLFLFVSGVISILYFMEKNRVSLLESKNNSLRNSLSQLDEQSKLIVKTDLKLARLREELDKKIVSLYTLHEVGKKISSTFNIENIYLIINEPLVRKLGFSKALIMLDNKFSKTFSVKISIGYTALEAKQIENKNTSP